MFYLTYDQILEVHKEAIESNLEQKRVLLLGGMAKAYTASLQIQPDSASQLLSDLTSMNSVEEIIGGVVPIEQWLRTASYLTAAFPSKQRFFRELADEVAAKRGKALTEQGDRLVVIQERVIFINDMVPFGFLEGARQTGAAVARMIVPRLESGIAAAHPFSAEPMRYFGTGWLIGPRHVITNHHVINARDRGEPAASDADFKTQGERAAVHFDYDFDGATGVTMGVSRIVLSQRELDFAVLELSADPRREPLALWGRELSLPNGSYVPVNVIQHPGGAPKQMGIRNNLVAKLTDADLAYFTDTDGGSSGSPVCNDAWQVVALHKASTRTHGAFEFQGKQTAWVNIGTRIDRIIAFLKSSHPAVWESIGANVYG